MIVEPAAHGVHALHRDAWHESVVQALGVGGVARGRFVGLYGYWEQKGNNLETKKQCQARARCGDCSGHDRIAPIPRAEGCVLKERQDDRAKEIMSRSRKSLQMN